MAIRLCFLLIITTLLVTACSEKKEILEPKALHEFFPGDISSVDSIEILSGSTGKRIVFTDNEQVQDWIHDIKDEVLIPDPNQEGRSGFLYSVSLSVGKERKLDFTPSSIGGHYYLYNQALHEHIRKLFESKLMPEEMPANFAFSVRYGVGSKNVVDTFNNVIVKDLISAGTAEVKVALSMDEMKAVYEQMKKVNVLETKNLVGDKSCSVVPHGEDLWEIRIGEIERTFQWTTKQCDITLDAKELMELRNFVMKIVQAKEEYRKLPEPEGGYL